MKTFNLLFFYVLVLFACNKDKSVVDTPKKSTDSITEFKSMVAIYEEMGSRHNQFLYQSFPILKERLSKFNFRPSILGSNSTLGGTSSNIVSDINPDDLRDLVLDVSSEQLSVVIGSQYSPVQIRDGLENNMPHDLTMLDYNSINEGIQENISNFEMSNEFANALYELDQILENCNNYSDSVNILSSLDLLLNQRSLNIGNLTEREAFIGGVILAKYSFRYWAENQSLVNELFAIYSSDTLKGTISGFKVNPVKSDVRGMVIGGIRGAITGGMWGSAAPGIGTALGAISGGILGAGFSGATSSLAAGIYIAIFH